MDRHRSTQLGRATAAEEDNPAWADVPWWAIGLIFARVFVPKPFSTKMLLACVRQALDDR